MRVCYSRVVGRRVVRAQAVALGVQRARRSLEPQRPRRERRLRALAAAGRTRSARAVFAQLQLGVQLVTYYVLYLSDSTLRGIA